MCTLDDWFLGFVGGALCDALRSFMCGSIQLISVVYVLSGNPDLLYFIPIFGREKRCEIRNQYPRGCSLISIVHARKKGNICYSVFNEILSKVLIFRKFEIWFAVCSFAFIVLVYHGCQWGWQTSVSLYNQKYLYYRVLSIFSSNNKLTEATLLIRFDAMPISIQWEINNYRMNYLNKIQCLNNLLNHPNAKMNNHTIGWVSTTLPAFSSKGHKALFSECKSKRAL